MVKQRDSLAPSTRKHLHNVRNHAASANKASAACRLSGRAGGMTLTRRAAQSEGVRRPLEPRHANRPDDFLRSIRPRPLHVEDRMRVFWGHSDPNLKVVDDGAFAKWLQSQDQYTSCSAAMASLAARAGHDQIAVVGYGFNPLPGTLADQTRICGMGMLKAPPAIGGTPAWHRSSEEEGGRPSSNKPAGHRRQHSKLAPAAGPPIAIPSFRVVKRQASNALHGLPKAKQLQGYIRYVPSAAEEQDAAMEYDMDSDDEEWLAAYQQQLVSGSSRKTKRSRQEVKAGQQAAAAAVKTGKGDLEGSTDPMTEDVFEQIIDTLEKAHHAALQAMCQTGSLPMGQPIPAAHDVLSADAALEACRGLSAHHVSAVYSHWLTKQLPTRRPLLQRLWFQAPWHSLGLQWGASTSAQGPPAQKEPEQASDSEECLPFVGRDTPPSLAARVPAMSEEEARVVLDDARADLERLRTLIDQVRRRERLKRRLAQVRQQEIALHFGPFSKQPPVPASSSPASKLQQSSPRGLKLPDEAPPPAAASLSTQSIQQRPAQSEAAANGSPNACLTDPKAGPKRMGSGPSARSKPITSCAQRPLDVDSNKDVRQTRQSSKCNSSCVSGRKRKQPSQSGVDISIKQISGAGRKPTRHQGLRKAADGDFAGSQGRLETFSASRLGKTQREAAGQQHQEHNIQSTETTLGATQVASMASASAQKQQQARKPRPTHRQSHSLQTGARQQHLALRSRHSRGRHRVRFHLRHTRSAAAGDEAIHELDHGSKVASRSEWDRSDQQEAPQLRARSRGDTQSHRPGTAVGVTRTSQRAQAAIPATPSSPNVHPGSKDSKQARSTRHTTGVAPKSPVKRPWQSAAQEATADPSDEHGVYGRQAGPDTVANTPEGDISPAAVPIRRLSRSTAHCRGPVARDHAAAAEGPEPVGRAAQHHTLRKHGAGSDIGHRARSSQQPLEESSVDGGSATSEDEVHHAGSPAGPRMPAPKVTASKRKAVSSRPAAAPAAHRRRMYSLNSSPGEPASSVEWDSHSRSHALQSPHRTTPPRTRNSQSHRAAKPMNEAGLNACSPSPVRKGVVRNGFAWLRSLVYGSMQPRQGAGRQQLAPTPRNLRSKKQMVTRSHHV